MSGFSKIVTGLFMSSVFSLGDAFSRTGKRDAKAQTYGPYSYPPVSPPVAPPPVASFNGTCQLECSVLRATNDRNKNTQSPHANVHRTSSRIDVKSSDDSTLLLRIQEQPSSDKRDCLTYYYTAAKTKFSQLWADGFASDLDQSQAIQNNACRTTDDTFGIDIPKCTHSC